jgi:hypothetical protein
LRLIILFLIQTVIADKHKRKARLRLFTFCDYWLDRADACQSKNPAHYRHFPQDQEITARRQSLTLKQTEYGISAC